MWDGNKLRISTQPSGASTLGRLEVVFSMHAGQMEIENSIAAGILPAARSKHTYMKH